MSDLSHLPEAARAFLEGEVELLPRTLVAAEIDRLVALLVDRKDGVRLEQLATSADKRLAKPARRGLHLLRTRGVALPGPAPRRFRIDPGPYVAAEEAPSLATHIDAEDEQWVFLVRPAVDRIGLDVFQARLSDVRGLVDFSIAPLSRKEWRSHERGILDEPHGLAAQVPFAYAHWLVERAYQRSLAESRAVPSEFGEARLELGVAQRPSEHPALALAPPLPPDEARGRLSELHRLDGISEWNPPREFFDQLELAGGQVMTSQLLVDDTQRLAQLDAEIDRVADRALTGPLRARLAERLLDTALLLHARGRVDAARLAASAAALTGDESVSGAANPFVRGLFDKLIDRAALLADRRPR